MSNSVFLFIFGLTLGILISLSLVSRYQRTIPEIPSGNTAVNVIIRQPAKEGDMTYVNSPSTGREQAVQSKDLNSVTPSNLSSDTTSDKKLSAVPTSASFWIPGREGAYLKFKNSGDGASISPLTAGIDLISDFFSGNGKESKDGTSHDSFSNVAGGRRGYGRNSAGVGSSSSRGIDASSKIRQGQNGQDEEGVQEKLQSSESDINPLVTGQRGNGKKKRGQKGTRVVSDRRENEKSSNKETTENLALGPLGAVSVNAGDDIRIQSRFFNEIGDRIDPLSAVIAKGGETDLLYNHPPLQPYHTQSREGHLLSPPYAPSLSSVIAQRSAMLYQEDMPVAGVEVIKRKYFSSR